MARPLRLEYPGAVYHINSRGNRQDHIFRDDDDFELFLSLLKNSIERMNWVCHAYCLMDNHYHLLLEIPEGILSRGMAWLNGVYTQKFNRKYGFTGHLFQGRYKSKPVQDDAQFLNTARYIARNPVDAKIVEDAGHWPWSSYRATVGEIKHPDFLFVDDILSCLSEDRSLAQMLFRELVSMELKDDDDQIVRLFQKVFGEKKNPSFSNRVRPVLDVKNSMGPISRKQRILSRPGLAELFNGVSRRDLETRNRIICDAFKHYGYTQSEIARFLDLDQTTISKIINKTN